MDISSLLNKESAAVAPAGPLATPPLEQQCKPLLFLPPATPCTPRTPLTDQRLIGSTFVNGFPSPSSSLDNELTHTRPHHQRQHPYYQHHQHDLAPHGRFRHHEETTIDEPMPVLTGPALKAERRVQALIHYHHHLRFPVDATKNERDMWRLWIGRSALSRDGRSLYEKGTDGQWRRYLRPRERAPVMRRIHEDGQGGHRKAGDLLRALRTGGYTWKGMTADVRRFVAECTVCAVRCARGQRSTYRHRLAGSMNDSALPVESYGSGAMGMHPTPMDSFNFPYSPSCSPEPATARSHHV